MDLTEITDEQVQMAVHRLNHRPQKVLGFRTPNEVFFEGRIQVRSATADGGLV